MSVTLNLLSNITVAEILETNVPAATSNKRTITHDQFNTAATLNAESTPPATKVACFEQTLTGGTDTVDLTNLTGTNGSSVDGTGLRVQAMKVKSKSDNSGSATIAIGASNGYDGFGANFEITLAPGGEQTIFTNDAGGDIGATKKDLDITGTADDVLEIAIVMG